MIIDISNLPDQPELRMKTLIEEITKRVQFKEKGRTLSNTTSYEFDDIKLDHSFVNSNDKFTVLFCEKGSIVVNEIRTMWPGHILICSTLGKNYNMHSLDPSGGKIYAFI